MSRTWRHGLCGAVVVALALSFSGAAAQPDRRASRQARQLFYKGNKQYRLGSFDKALELFQRSLEQANRPNTIFNIAQCYRQLKNTEKALFNYKLYLSEWERMKPGTTPPHSTEVKTRIAELEAELEQERQEQERRENARKEKERKARAQRGPSAAKTGRNAELQAVELALHEDLVADYRDYLKSEERSGGTTYVRYRYRRAKTKRLWGMILTLGCTPFFLSAALGGYFGVYSSDNDLRDHEKREIGGTMLGVFSVLAVGSLVTGLVLWVQGGGEMGKLEPMMWQRAGLLSWPSAHTGSHLNGSNLPSSL